MEESLPQRPAPSVERLMSAPVDVLLAEAGALVMYVEMSSVFVGEVLDLGDKIVLALPTGRVDAERHNIVRYLLGRVQGVDMPALPAPLETIAA